MRKFAAVLALVLALAGGGAYLLAGGETPVQTFRTGEVTRGDVEASVSASGTLAPVVTVEVGSQISGQIQSLEADFNTEVKKGQVIARLDPETFETKVAQAAADLEVARSGIAVQEATLERSRADLEAARQALVSLKAQAQKTIVTARDLEREYLRRRELFQSGTASRADTDKAKAAFDSATAEAQSQAALEQSQVATIRSGEAQVRISEAQLANARALTAQKAAALRQAQIDLERTTIRSPVDGIVVLRNVNAGQTVAASLQAPILFQIAEDLRKMQVQISVDEADVGRVRPGLDVLFTVDAHPGRTFEGRVQQVRMASTVQQNVVTYTAVVLAGNPDLALLPGMTANARIVVDRRKDALTVPNAALRFRPPAVEASARTPPSGENPWSRPKPEEQARILRDRLTRALDLAPAQVAQLQEIVGDTQARMAALQGLPEMERRRRADQIRAEDRERITRILTLEQKARYEALNADPRAGGTAGQVFVPGSDGQPKPVFVRLGISDGSRTEILSDELKAGDAVLTGVTSTRATGTSSFGASLRTTFLR